MKTKTVQWRSFLSLIIGFFFISTISFSQEIQIKVDAAKGHLPISPWIYGRNNNVGSDVNGWEKYNSAGLRMYRENGGNNATKYNWKLKLTSHPDWYNNVYTTDWDASAAKILNNTSNTQGMFALQLLGKAAYTTNNNFNDWAYDQSSGGNNTSNWAGGGGPGVVGNPALYLRDWSPDSSTGILQHWFHDLKYDSTSLRYWNMDNEPEVWSSTHDDAATSSITAEDYIQKYIAVAKSARLNFPGIKLVGPVSTNEWQWFTWNNNKVKDASDGKLYPWMEYFIKRISEEQKKSGLKLLDVLDVHFYPGTQSDPDLTLQLHRIWYDTLWNYPGANGVKVTSASGWDENLTKEYFFERCNRWLNQYMGNSHGVKPGISEYGTINSEPNIVACWYASHLGTFANHGVELFTPWDWYIGQWEVLNLFSNYAGKYTAEASSSDENKVSAFSSITDGGDSLIITLVNRDRIDRRSVSITLQNFKPLGNLAGTLQLANLPATETYISANQNALQKSQASINGNQINLTLPKLSITMVRIPAAQPVLATDLSQEIQKTRIYPNPSKGVFRIEPVNGEKLQISLMNILMQSLRTWDLSAEGLIDISSMPNGTYILQLKSDQGVSIKKIIKE